jgi:hypothetical protein
MTIRTAVEQYIEHKHALGVKFISAGVILRSFARPAGDANFDDFRVVKTSAHSCLPRTPPQTARQKWSTLRGLPICSGQTHCSRLPCRFGCTVLRRPSIQ